MKTITCDDRIGHRGLHHKNLLVVQGRGIVEFRGESIAPVAMVVKEDYSKNGKWSCTTWSVDLTDDAVLVSFSQDWEMGVYFPEKTWPLAVERMRRVIELKMADHGLDDAVIERAIRAVFPKAAADLDAAVQSWEQAGDQFSDLLAAQADLAAAQSEYQAVEREVSAMEEAETARREAAETRERVAKAREAMRSGASLAELRALMVGSS